MNRSKYELLSSRIECLETRRLFSALFGPVTKYASGNGPEPIVSADLNGDKRPDLLVGNYLDGTVSVFLNQGNGKFKLTATVNVGEAQALSSMAVADFNGDGKPDVAIVGNDLVILSGTGGGKFAAPVHYAAGTSPQNVVAGNLVNGGRPDVAVTDIVGDQVLIFKNTGTGKFAAPTKVTGIPGAAGIVAGDFNGDKNIDLAVTSFGHVTFDPLGGIQTGPSDGVRLLLGDGKGGFKLGNKLKVSGNHPTAITAADLNADGKLDLVTCDGGLDGLIGTSTVSVLQNLGAGTFAAPRVLSTGGSPTYVAVADVNHDGRLDIVTADATGDDISIFTAKAGSFAFNIDQKITNIGGPSAVLLLDVNADGKPDLITDSDTNNTLDILLGI